MSGRTGVAGRPAAPPAPGPGPEASAVEDTIAAIATPLGEGGLAVVRISGPMAATVADRIFEPAGKGGCRPSAAASHTIHYGHVLRNEVRVDEVMLSVMRAPRTFTREDVVEISCHGGMLAVRAVLEAAIERGARPAEPGEFTKRAFLNGRIDLAQAEAVADVIHARTELALRAAEEQLAGKLSAQINQLRDRLIATLAHVEAHIDFPDEDIAPDTMEDLLARLDAAADFVRRLLRYANEGQLLRRGIRTAIVGRPNSGKSSLLNLLLGHDRAIVSPVAGTTRDTIEETANIRGVPVVFVDTAGLRESADEIEREGIRRSRDSLRRADLILHVIDGSESMDPVDRAYLDEFSHKKRLIVVNKSDLPPRLNWPGDRQVDPPSIAVSCLSGDGLDALRDEIRRLMWAGEIHSDMMETMINARHQDSLKRAEDGIDRAAGAMRSGLTLELAALDLRIAVDAVGEVVGKTATEDLLDSIFSQFCIGK